MINCRDWFARKFWKDLTKPCCFKLLGYFCEGFNFRVKDNNFITWMLVLDDWRICLCAHLNDREGTSELWSMLLAKGENFFNFDRLPEKRFCEHTMCSLDLNEFSNIKMILVGLSSCMSYSLNRRFNWACFRISIPIGWSEFKKIRTNYWIFLICFTKGRIFQLKAKRLSDCVSFSYRGDATIMTTGFDGSFKYLDI